MNAVGTVTLIRLLLTLDNTSEGESSALGDPGSQSLGNGPWVTETAESETTNKGEGVNPVLLFNKSKLIVSIEVK